MNAIACFACSGVSGLPWWLGSWIRSWIGQPFTVFEMMTLPGLIPNGYLNTESIAATQAFWQRLGLLQTTVEPEKIVDHGYMDYALDVLGRLP